MMPRIARNRLLPLALAVVLSLVFAPIGRSQDTPEPTATDPTTAPATETTEAATPTEQPAEAPAPAAAEPAAFDLKVAVENFWHYGKVARYDLANQYGQQVLGSGAAPPEILATFEQVAQQRKDSLDQWMLRWQGTREMQDVTTQLINVLEQGRRGRGQDANYIQQNIDRLSTNERAYTIALGRLRTSGELAVPFMIDTLRDAGKAQHHGAVRRALREMGKYALAPLCAATEMKDWDTLVTVCGVLGDLGYDAAAPYLARLTTDAQVPTQVKAAAARALLQLNVQSSRGVSAADMFYELGDKLYYDRASITADNRLSVAYIWYWSDQGLIKKDVPPPIFNELMCMRACEYALRLGGSQGDALSLWLAANYKREVELPEGAVDTTRLENQPDAHYYGVVTGSQYLNSALDRTIRDRNAPVSMRIIKSLQEIIGQSNMFSGAASRPLIAAMQYPDRLVRFEAALALAGAIPQREFEGQDMVVPLLAEALSQTGQPTVFGVMPSQDQVNALVEGFRAAGYKAEGATTPEAAVANASALPGVDAFIISQDLFGNEVDQLLAMLRQNARLRGSARIIVTETGASRFEALKVNDPLLSTTIARDAETMRTAIEEARKKAGSLPLSGDSATEYATRAGNSLWRVAASRGQVYDVSAAKTALLGALSDARPEIVILAGNVLGLLNDAEAQSGLLQAGQAEANADDVKISLYKSLATNAKFFGALLDQGQIDMLQKIVAEAPNLQVRSAAAEAHGALNLPADQAKSLIVDQSRTTLGDPLKAPPPAEGEPNQ